MTDVIIRDAMADVLRKQEGHGRSGCCIRDETRLDYEGKRPVSCGGTGQKPEEPD